MLSVISRGQGEHDLLSDGRHLFRFSAWHNPYHQNHLYLDLPPECQSIPAGELFPVLRQAVGCPLQIMAYSDDPMVPYLLSGGFVRKRCCLEVTATPDDLLSPLPEMVTPMTAVKGTVEYDTCCRLLYDHYARTHQSVSPLTATLEQFRETLPETALYAQNAQSITHCAFVEPDTEAWEIAYVGTGDLSAFPSFAQAIVAQAFRETSEVTFECDDCDPAAVAMKGLFRVCEDVTFDTFVLN